MLKHITGLLMLLTGITGYSQNIQTATIEWNCNSTFTATPGNLVEEATKVVTNSQQIVWYNNNNEPQHTFTITGSNGSWSNVSNNGSAEFNVTSNGNNGIVKFSKGGGSTTIQIILVVDTHAQIYELSVNSTNAI